MTKDRAAANAIMDRIRVMAETADVPKLERLAFTFKTVREGMAYAPQESPSPISVLTPDRSRKEP
jgi:hypothetical protein